MDVLNGFVDEDRRVRTRTMDAAIGERVHSLMWQRRMTNASLARELRLDPTTFGRRLRGERGWTTDEIFWLAWRFEVPLNELFGGDPLEHVKKAPTPEGGGLESHLGESNPGPIHYRVATLALAS